MVDKMIVGVGEKRVVVLVYRLIVVLSECVAAMASTENTTGKRESDLTRRRGENWTGLTVLL
jgi:hypothetical protein